MTASFELFFRLIGISLINRPLSACQKVLIISQYIMTLFMLHLLLRQKLPIYSGADSQRISRPSSRKTQSRSTYCIAGEERKSWQLFGCLPICYSIIYVSAGMLYLFTSSAFCSVIFARWNKIFLERSTMCQRGHDT